MQNFFKVYEIIDNVCEELEVYPTYFVGAFLDKVKAEKLCKYIDIADCNSTKIKYGEITKEDVNDLNFFGLQGYDNAALKEISKLINTKKLNELEK